MRPAPCESIPAVSCAFLGFRRTSPTPCSTLAFRGGIVSCWSVSVVSCERLAASTPMHRHSRLRHQDAHSRPLNGWGVQERVDPARRGMRRAASAARFRLGVRLPSVPASPGGADKLPAMGPLGPRGAAYSATRSFSCRRVSFVCSSGRVAPLRPLSSRPRQAVVVRQRTKRPERPAHLSRRSLALYVAVHAAGAT